MKQDVYQKVTDKIIDDLEQGELTWIKPWSAGNMDGRIIKPLRHNGQPYNGINILMLWSAAIEGGFSSPFWMTFKQAKDFGAHVKGPETGRLHLLRADHCLCLHAGDGTGERPSCPVPRP